MPLKLATFRLYHEIVVARMSNLSKRETQTRILDAAELLFAGQGVGGTSLRSITVKAGVNLAAIHYHFGSKMALILAIFSRRLEPINQEQHRLLARCEKAGCCLEDVLHAFIFPVLAARDDNDAGAEAFLRILGNTIIEPDDALFRAIHEQFGDALNHFIGILRKTVPELTDEDFQVRFLFSFGAFSYSIGEPQNEWAGVRPESRRTSPLRNW